MVKVRIPRRIEKIRAVNGFGLISLKDEMDDSFNLRNFYTLTD